MEGKRKRNGDREELDLGQKGRERESERGREVEDEDRGQKGGKIETKRKGESILG